jgi:DNA helicase II / ATP-dependent DNA helicase PcrA
MTSYLETLLDSLNAEQQQAVLHTEGPLLILAGAGTGKTKVLTTRLAHLLLTGKAEAHQILAVTFTNKASKEMLERVQKLIGPHTEQLWLGTFHSLATRILRRHAHLVGLQSNFTILDSDDQLRLLKKVMAQEQIDEKRYPPKLVIGYIDRFKDKGYQPSTIPSQDLHNIEGGLIIKHLYECYQQRLLELNAVDFGNLLLHTLHLFQNNEQVLAIYQNLFRYILVDEYQDTNIVQYLWLRLLAQKNHNICCVGDDDQSIYAWRGAEIGNILKFDKDFPQAQVIRLEQNYRSTQNILDTASALIHHNKDRLGKKLWTTGNKGDKISIYGAYDGDEEARWVVNKIQTLYTNHHNLSHIAILVRAGFQSREFEEQLLNRGIPYRVIGGLRFYERQEIRDALAYLRLIEQPSDSLAFERIVNLPKRGLGPSALQIIHTLARDQHLSLYYASEQVLKFNLFKPQAHKSLLNFMQTLERLKSYVTHLTPSNLAQKVLDETGYIAMWQQDKSPEAAGRLDNLKELISAIAEFNTLQDFLEHVSLVIDKTADHHQDSVTLMTLHGAKGLEFETVFLPGWEEGVFPHARALAEKSFGLEEERRLAYVGLTRAKKQAFISFAANRRIYNQWQNSMPSRFLKELPEESVEWLRSGLFQRAPHPKHHVQTTRSHETKIIPTFPAGTRVQHQFFGEGIVEATEGNFLVVDFDDAGHKKIMARFLEKVS